MSKRIRRALVELSVIVLIAASFALAALYPTYGDICEQQANAAEKNCATYDVTSYTLIKIAAWIENHNGTITALASVVVAIFTWTLWRSSEKMWQVTRVSADAARISAFVARKSLLEADQPLITMSNLDLLPPSKGKSARITFSIGNAGKRTLIANNVIADFDFFVLRKDGQNFGRRDRFEEGFNAAVEAGETTDPSAILCRVLTAADVKNIRAGKGHFAVSFIIQGKDALGVEYEADFPFVYNVAQQRFIKLASASKRDEKTA